MLLLKRMSVLMLMVQLAVVLGESVTSPPKVFIEQGVLVGSYTKSFSGRQILAFEGIPYAKSPVGKYRFREPQPPKPWNGLWSATKQGSVCLQYDHMQYLASNPIVGDEDCLFINVYTPKLPSSVGGGEPLLDVIVYIHGGGYTSGSGNLYSPRYLLDKDVVYVTFNYRLGPLGFLSTEDEVVPGNMGLKDQNAALKWIQKNIVIFGGNPASVTITGMSAGGASVQYHYLSPLSRGLFHKGFSMSGSAILPWVQSENMLEKAKKLGAELGCSTQSSLELVHCLRHRPARAIVSLLRDTEHFMPWHYCPYSPFGPVVEKAGQQPFLSETPYKLLAEGNVQDLPWIASVTTEEGLYPTANFVANSTLLAELDSRWTEIAPHLMDFNQTVDRSLIKETANKIKQEYLGNKKISPATNRQLTHMVGDRLYVVDVERAAKLQAAATTMPVYFYRFAYRGQKSYTEFMTWGSKDDFGVSHGDDTMYALGTFYAFPEDTSEDRAMIKRMVNMWTSFASTGVPLFGDDVTWMPVSRTAGIKGKLDFLQIDSSSSMFMTTSNDLGRRTFWNSLPFNEPQRLLTLTTHATDEL